MSQSRTLISLATLGAVSLGWFHQAAPAANRPPNIVFLLTDNHRWDALGCYGNPVIETPHIDQLAARGVRFTNAFCTTSICAASRASILNGQYRQRHGFTFQRPDIPLQAMLQSYPAVLRRAGYRTGFVGKLGLDVRDGVLDELFDFVELNRASSRRHPYYRPGPADSLQHLTSINGDHALAFLRSCRRDQPFCLSVSFSAPHPEDDHPDQYIFDRQLASLYADVSIPSPAVSEPRYFEQLPEFIRISMNRERWFRRFDTPEKYQRMMKGMYRLISGVDRQVGRIMKALKDSGVADNTVVIMTADNGLLAGEHGLTGIWLMYEQSIRLPLVVYDPRRAPPQAGGTIEQMALNVDFAPTILDLAGIPPAAGMQGRSLVPLWENRAPDWREDFYYEHYFRPTWVPSDQGNIPRSEGVRTRDWKYVRYFDEDPVYEQLFDLQKDPWETNNLANAPDFSQRKRRLRARMLALRGEVAALDLAAIHRAADYSKLANKAEVKQLAAVAGGSEELSAESRAEGALRVALLGNTLIEREAEHGYLEAELTRLWPQTDIVFRNLGWAGDTVQGRARVEFGPGEEQQRAWQRPEGPLADYGLQKLLAHIYQVQPDLLFIAYGSNVAFTGSRGLSAFESGLSRLLKALQPTEVRIVLVAPPPRELRGRGRKRLAEQNRRLQQVSRHLQRVAADRGHLFVDLFHRWTDSPKKAVDFTDNGIHLNASGYRRLAAIVSRELKQPVRTWRLHLTADGRVVSSLGTAVESIGTTPFGLQLSLADVQLPSPLGAQTSAGPQSQRAARKLRIDGLQSGVYMLDIDGRRVARASAEQWAAAVTIETGPDFDQVQQLRQVIQDKNRLHFYGFRPQNKAYIKLFRRHERGHHAAELRQFSRLVREREADIARLRVPLVRHYELMREDDYPEHEVPRLAQSAEIEAELRSFTINAALSVNLFAANPQISNPININWDERGRMWVATSTTYPHLQPGQAPDDRIVILEDIDADGRADKHTVFAEGLLVPHAVLPARDGAFVTQSTDLLFLRDTDGDGAADERRVVLTGFGNADVHHMIHGLRWGPAGGLYFNQSIYINSTVETPWGVQQVNGSCVWKLDPATLRLVPFSRGLVNPWGHAFDRWGQSFATDGAGGDGIAYLFPGSAYPTHGAFARALESLNPGRPKECGLEVVSGRHFPQDWQGGLVTCDFRANRVTRYALTAEGSGYRSQFLGDVLSSAHRAFRPVDVKLGPDGALYVVDWYNEIIDHGEVDFHHPLRDKRHGRIWRITVRERPLVEPPLLEDAAPERLLDALKLPEDWTRDQARRLLREQDREAVVPACQQWVERLDSSDPDFEHQRLEALWVFQGVGEVQADLLQQTLASPDHRVRAAAVRVLAAWHTRLPEAYALLAAVAQDEHPQVRLEAAHALRGVGTRESVELALSLLDRPLDEFLDFAVWLTAREHRSSWLTPLLAGEFVFDGEPGKLAFAIAAAEEPAAIPALVGLLEANKLTSSQRQQALRTLALIGGPQQQALVVDELLKSSPQRAALLLSALEEARWRERPPPNAAHLQQLLDSADHRVRLQTLGLIRRWRLSAAKSRLLSLVRAEQTDSAERLAAARGLVAVDGERGLMVVQDLAQRSVSIPVRISALAAWAWQDAEGAADAAARLLSSLEDSHDPKDIVAAYVGQLGGAELLAAALQDQAGVSASVARAAVRFVRQSGRELPELVQRFTQLGKLEPLPQKPTPQQLARLVADVVSRGDAHRGQRIFRRSELQCIKCHAVGGGGGRVGPDLSSLGGTARIDSLVMSLLDPNAKIKEGYQTTTVLTAAGQVVSGRIHRQTAEQVVLLTAESQLVRLAEDEVEEMAASPTSLMPVGLVKTLRRDELVDLVRFLAALGKEDAFRVPARDLVRRWQVLEPTVELMQRIRRQGDEVVVAGDEGLRWSTHYSTVQGFLPLVELPSLKLDDQPLPRYVRFTISAKASATIELALAKTEQLAAWVDGKPVTLLARTPLVVSPGETTVTLRLGAARVTPLSIEVRRSDF